MRIISRDEESGFAPFDLAKTPKIDKKTGKAELAMRSFDLATKYMYAAKLLVVNNPQFILVGLANIAFACELYLKALLNGYGIDFQGVHELKDLFEKLPEDIKAYVANNINIENRETEFWLCLKEQNKAFVTYRYINEAQEITANPNFLFAFALVLKHVYESLVEQYEELSEKGDAP